METRSIFRIRRGRAGRTTLSSKRRTRVQISANGQRLSSNNFQTLDGVSVNSFNLGGAALVTPNQESVKEIRVLANSYSAEDGRNSGAQIRGRFAKRDQRPARFVVLRYNSPELNALISTAAQVTPRALASTIIFASSAAVWAAHCRCRDSARAERRHSAAKTNRSSSFRTKDCGTARIMWAGLMSKRRSSASSCCNSVRTA